MTIDEFRASLNEATAPESLSPYLLALWHERRGDWNRAHEIVQDIGDRRAASVHAYLHRREGNEDNAAYWYRQAGSEKPTGSSDQEWDELVTSLLT